MTRMKKNTIFMCLSLGLAGLLSSCSSFDNPYEPKEISSEKGLLTLNLASGVEFNVATRAADETLWRDKNNYDITITKIGGTPQTKKYSEWKFPMSIDPGDYQVSASYGEEMDASHDTFLSTGTSETFSITAGQPSNTVIECTPTAGKIIVEFASDMDTYCSDYSVDFTGTTALGSKKVTSSKTDNSPWYLAIKEGGEKINYTINVTTKTEYAEKKGSVTGDFPIERNHTKKLTIKANHTPNTEGGISITITIDKGTEERTEDIEIPVTWVN
jgi:hypothetical protein